MLWRFRSAQLAHTKRIYSLPPPGAEMWHKQRTQKWHNSEIYQFTLKREISNAPRNKFDAGWKRMSADCTVAKKRTRFWGKTCSVAILSAVKRMKTEQIKTISTPLEFQSATSQLERKATHMDDDWLTVGATWLAAAKPYNLIRYVLINFSCAQSTVEPTRSLIGASRLISEKKKKTLSGDKESFK